MALSKEERLRRVHGEAMAEWNRIQSAVRDERLQCLEDRRFASIAGAQWEGPLGEQFDNKPRFEVNKVQLALIRIYNEYRNNRIAVNFQPKDGKEADALADTCDGLFRADFADSCGEEAKDNAFEEAAAGGFGAYRLRACYEDELDEENTKQRIRFEPIFDADSCVFFDLDAKRQDKSDAKRCFVLHSRTRAGYIEEFGDDPGTWPKQISRSEFDWSTPDLVYFAEYYVVEETSEVQRVFVSLTGEEMVVPQAELDEDEAKLGELLAAGFREVRTKRVKRKRVHKYLLGGNSVLEDEGYIAGECIPIIPVFGKRWFVDGVERCMGHVRLAKDAMRLANMLRSKIGEIAVLSSVEKPIFTPEQVAAHQVMWTEDNVKNYPFLLVDPITDANGQKQAAGPIAYTKAPQVPPAIAALLQVSEQDLKDLLGDQQAAEKVVSNISGKAVELIQQRLDMQTYIYISNMAKADRRAGEVWLSMAKDVYVEEGRSMKTIGADESTGSVELMRPVYDEEAATERYENDLSEARYDVTVEVGPSSSSRRQSLVRELTGVLQITTDPEVQQVLQSLIMANLEGEGMQEVREWFRARLLKMGVAKPTAEEQEKLAAEAEAAAGAPPDPQTQYLLAAADAEQAKASDSRAATIVKVTQAEKNRADTAKTLAEIDADELRVSIEAAEALRKATEPPAGTAPLP